MIIVGTHQAAMDLMEKQASITADRPVSIMAGATMSGGMRLLLTPYGERWRLMRK